MSHDNHAALLGEALGLDEEQSPFPWQTRLLDLLMRGEIPRSLDIPTGLGKTATIAIWLLARASGAPVPRRLVYVVDRRAVVDQATEVAMRLREWVARAPQDALVALDLEDRPLPISTLRGQFVDNREWLEDPASPAIIVGTLDMVGSRLLFEGYGCTRKMRPYHAGLLGSDSLFVLDEAHLIPPFERLLERIALDGADFGPRPDGDLISLPPIRLLSLSATGRSRGGEAFDLDSSDLRDPVIKQRLDAPKRLEVENVRPDGLVHAVAERAWELCERGARPIRCIVFTTRREHAEKALSALSDLAGLDDKRRPGDDPAVDVELLVGGRRVFERARAAEQLAHLGFLAGSETPRQRPAFLFATSAGEVGVDLDADHMVCDLVSWERMVQRLGRVNRRGEGDALVDVFVEPLPDKTPPEAISLRESAARLLERLPKFEDGRRDLSLGAIRELQRTAMDDHELATLVQQASTPAPLYPALERPTLDAWSMTSLLQHPGRPVVAPWLRGWVEDRPQTTVVWRTHLPVPEERPASSAELKRFFEAAPPHASEKLDTETFRVVDWLLKRATRLVKHADEGTRADDVLGHDTTVGFISGSNREDISGWSLTKLARTPRKELERALPGTTFVLDARFGGLRHGLLDPAFDEAPETLDGSPWLDGGGEGNGGGDGNGNGNRNGNGNGNHAGPAIRFRVVHETKPQAIDDRAGWRERERLPMQQSPDGEVSRWLVVQKWRHDAATEDDRSAGRPQTLREHQDWATAKAQNLARRLSLPPAAAKVLTTAARLHDEGKRAQRWQAAFRAPDDGEIYAKTLGPLNVHLLDGYRHEFGSLPFAESDAALTALPADERDLVLHLIASHHGFARPVIGTKGCEDGPPSALAMRARRIAVRFARLQRRWGPWGLAWWEALLRAADQQASRDNDKSDRGPALIRERS